MQQLTKTQDAILKIGGILLIAGAALYMFFPLAAFCIFAAGVLAFGCMQMLQAYNGNNFIIRRLRRQQLLGVIALLLAACCMCMQTFHFGFAIRNEWVVCLTIGAILELWTAFRIPLELEKERKVKSEK